MNFYLTLRSEEWAHRSLFCRFRMEALDFGVTAQGRLFGQEEL
jgi:hypothetical protein